MLTTIFSLLLLQTASPPGTLILAEDAKTPYVIYVGAGASLPEKHAAEELSAFLSRISGAVFPVRQVDSGSPPTRNAILVGPDLAAAGGIDPAKENLGAEGYVILARDRMLLIAGGRPRGTLYGVYDFLHYLLGVRWLAPDCTVIPKRDRLVLKSFRRRYVPPLEYRATDYPNSRDADWAARNHLNGTQTCCDAERGGKIKYSHFVHTFNSILNPEKYFKSHPEYFSEINGKRVGGRTQLCLTNPEVLKIAISTVKRWIKEAPDASIFSVSQNDWHNYCTCKNCRAAAKEEGSQSGPLLRFVNAIAAAIAKEHPNAVIDTLAYQYTRKPPRITKPLPNVIVRLCSIECCFSHPLESDPYNAPFRSDTERWGKVCRRLYVWDYVIDYSHSIQPFPNLYVIKPNIRFFIRNGVRGVYEEANYFSRGGEFAELRSYLMARTLWDPDYDTDKAIDEFLAGFYGEAAAPIRAYIDLLHKRAETPDRHCTIWTPPTHPLYGDEFIPRAVALFNEAERRAVKDSGKLFRVKTARLPVTYLRLARAADSRFRKEDPAFDPSVDYRKLLDRFLTVASRAGVTRVCESGRGVLSTWEKSIKPRLPAPVPFRVLLVTGHDYPGHKWKETAPLLKKILETSGRLKVTITENPDSLAAEDLSGWDVVLLHFADWGSWSASPEAGKRLADFVERGGGLAAIHFACGAFQKWPGFVKLLGRVYDRKRTHDPYRRFTVKVEDHRHPITAGLEDFPTTDELYFCLTGETKIKVLCTAHSHVTGKDELMAHVLRYGKGRVFFTPLGHDLRSLSAPGFGKLLTRACIWTAGGIVE